MRRISRDPAISAHHRGGGAFEQALPPELRRGGVHAARGLPHHSGESERDRSAGREVLSGSGCGSGARSISWTSSAVPEFVPEIVEAAIRNGAKAIWMQEGVVHEDAARRAAEAGLDVVMDRCILKEHRRLV